MVALFSCCVHCLKGSAHSPEILPKIPSAPASCLDKFAAWQKAKPQVLSIKELVFPDFPTHFENSKHVESFAKGVLKHANMGYQNKVIFQPIQGPPQLKVIS